MSNPSVSNSQPLQPPTRLVRSQSLGQLPSQQQSSLAPVSRSPQPDLLTSQRELSSEKMVKHLTAMIDDTPVTQLRSKNSSLPLASTDLARHIARKSSQVQKLDQNWAVSPKNGRNQGLEHILDYRLAPPPKSSWQLPREKVQQQPQLLDIYNHLASPSTGSRSLRQLKASTLQHEKVDFQPTSEHLKVFTDSKLLVPSRDTDNKPRYESHTRVGEIQTRLQAIQQENRSLGTELGALKKELGLLNKEKSPSLEQTQRIEAIKQRTQTLTQLMQPLNEEKKTLDTELAEYQLYDLAQETGKKNRISDLANFSGQDMGGTVVESIDKVTDTLVSLRQRGDVDRSSKTEHDQQSWQAIVPSGDPSKSDLGIWEAQSGDKTKMSSWYKTKD